MATLHNRLIQSGEGNDIPEDAKIPIHGWMAVFREWCAGEVTAAQVIALYSLDASAQTQGNSLKALYDTAPDKTAFLRVFKDWLYMGELQLDARYASVTNLDTRLRDEIVTQGGTPP